MRGEELTVEDVVKWVPPVSTREVERALRSLGQRKEGRRGRVSWRGMRPDEEGEGGNTGEGRGEGSAGVTGDADGSGSGSGKESADGSKADTDEVD